MNKAIWRLILTYAIIFSAIYICATVSFWFYPIAVVILGNQYLTLSLLGHEGTHGLLHKNRFINRTLARIFCHFPLFTSHTHYSMNHLRHHRNLGTDGDPDINIYQNSYSSVYDWAMASIRDSFNLSLLKKFIDYFNGSRAYFSGNYPYNIKTDYLLFYLFWICALVVVFYLKIQSHFLIYWLVPLLIYMPWILLMNSYQHYSENGPIAGRAYNIIFRSRLMQEFLFPINLNYHEIHHQRPDVPYSQLPQLYVPTQNSIYFSEFSSRVFNSQKNKIP